MNISKYSQNIFKGPDTRFLETCFVSLPELFIGRITRTTVLSTSDGCRWLDQSNWSNFCPPGLHLLEETRQGPGTTTTNKSNKSKSYIMNRIQLPLAIYYWIIFLPSHCHRFPSSFHSKRLTFLFTFWFFFWKQLINTNLFNLIFASQDAIKFFPKNLQSFSQNIKTKFS